jgi:hypothetical protein
MLISIDFPLQILILDKFFLIFFSMQPLTQASPAFDERWEKGRVRGGGVLTRLGCGEGHFLAATDKKVISWPRACVVSTIFT